MADVSISNLTPGTPAASDVLPFSNGTSTLKVQAQSIPVAWAAVTNKPAFASVATSGSYNDLSNKPTIPPTPLASPIAGYLLESNNSGTSFTLRKSFGLSSVSYSGGIWTLNYSSALSDRYVMVSGVGAFNAGSSGYQPAMFSGPNYSYPSTVMSNNFVKVWVSARGATNVDVSHSIIVFQ